MEGKVEFWEGSEKCSDGSIDLFIQFKERHVMYEYLLIEHSDKLLYFPGNIE